MVRFLFLLLFCLFPFFSYAVPPHVHFTLENGLEVLLLPSHRTKQAIHMIGYKVGARDEIFGKTGLAHFLEHMMFKGTKKFPGDYLSKFIASEGGKDNAFTSQDMTIYDTIIAPEWLDFVIQLEADRMQHTIFDQEACDTERKIVLEERTMRLENEPFSLFNEKLRHALLKESPYGRPSIGERKDIEALTLEDMRHFYKTYYVPNNAFLLIAGDIDVKKVERSVRQYYGPLEPGVIPPRAVIDPEKDRVKKPHFISHTDATIKQPEWSRLYKVPTFATTSEEEVASLEIGCGILGGGSTSRLYQTLVVDKKIASAVDCNYDLLGFYDNKLTISVTPQKNISHERISREVDQVISTMRQQPVDEEDLLRAKLLNKAESVYFQEGLVKQALVRALLMGYGLPFSFIEDMDFKINQATRENIREAFFRYLVPENSVTGYLHNGEIVALKKEGK